MKVRIRWLAGLVAVLMLAGLLAACGAQAPTSPAAEATSAPAPTTAPEPTEAPTEAPAVTEAPTEAPEAEVTAAPAAGAGGNLQIIWFAWQPCQALGELVKDYPDATVEVRCVPIAQWHDQIFTDFAARGGADLVI